MFNANHTASQVANLLRLYGSSVTITHAAGGNSKTSAIFMSSKKGSDATNPFSATSQLTIGSGFAFIPAIKKEPMPGDTLTSKLKSNRIVVVEAYCPADITIAYKLTIE